MAALEAAGSPARCGDQCAGGADDDSDRAITIIIATTTTTGDGFAASEGALAILLAGCGNTYHPEYHPVTAVTHTTTIQTGGTQPVYVPAPPPAPPPPVPPEDWKW